MGAQASEAKEAKVDLGSLGELLDSLLFLILILSQGGAKWLSISLHGQLCWEDYAASFVCESSRKSD
jgi:hypothetical protein